MSCRCRSSILRACEYLLFECKKSLTKCVKEKDLSKYKAVPLVGWGFLGWGWASERGWCSFVFNFHFSVIPAVSENAEAGEEEGGFKNRIGNL